MSTAAPSADLPPEPPVRPDDNACCNSGCTYCILDMYQDELAAYQIALHAWQQRQQPACTPRQD